jgi:hypothetical protein
LVGSLLSTAELEDWRAPDVRLRDPAIGVPLAQLCEGQPRRSLQRAVQLIEVGAFASDDDLSQGAMLAGRNLGSWRTQLPALGKLRAREVVEAVLRVEHSMRTNA